MKKVDTQINFKNDEVTMLGQKLKLKFTSSGHYVISLMGHYFEWDSQKVVKTVFLKIRRNGPRDEDKIMQEASHSIWTSTQK